MQATAPYRTNLAMVEVKPQYNADFKRIVSQEMAQSLKAENGVLAMYAATYKNQPNKWLFLKSTPMTRHIKPTAKRPISKLTSKTPRQCWKAKISNHSTAVSRQSRWVELGEINQCCLKYDISDAICIGVSEEFNEII